MPAVLRPFTVVDAEAGVTIVAALDVVHKAVPGEGELPFSSTEPVVAQIF